MQRRSGLVPDVLAGGAGGRRPVAPAYGLPDLLFARCLTKTRRIHDSSLVGAIVVDIAVVCRTGFSVEAKTGDSRKQEDPGDGGHVDSPKIDYGVVAREHLPHDVYYR